MWGHGWMGRGCVGGKAVVVERKGEGGRGDEKEGGKVGVARKGLFVGCWLLNVPATC